MSYISNRAHFIWSTAQREPWINPEWECRLFAYIGGVLRNFRATLLAAGGMEDHIHILAALPATLTLADTAAAMKSNSSRFIHEDLDFPPFDWQKGYAAFSVSVSVEETVKRYIQNQKTHHKKRSFQEEYIEFLNKHKIEYDPRYVFL